MKKLNYYIAFIFGCLFLATSCEIDNYDGPDATIQGTIYDHLNQPLQVSHGAGIIRLREISWAVDSTSYVGRQTLNVQQDGTYRNTKWFSGEYLMMPYSGAFFPYDDEYQDSDDAGELVKISGTTTKDFHVTPYLTVEWVSKPVVTADNYIECSARFTRNQKAGYEMPDVREAWLLVSRTVNTNSRHLDLYPVKMDLTNDMEGQELTFRTAIPLKYTGIDYWIRISMNCQTAAGKPETNYPGMGADNFTTVEKIHAP
ncbi:MAG: DUF3823 domain-containing protein [Dysgonamonadaceae bacterium]|jgi:hypothetical protein|nr:DUF3823 domain-containing protein [Dysgonamonadaceae bacterium]